MTFSPYTHDNAEHELEITDDGVVVHIDGSEAWREGKYMNERNVTISVPLPDDEVERLVRELDDEYTE